MSPLSAYFWPVLGAGLIIGILAAAIGFRRPRRFANDAPPEPIARDLRKRRWIALAAGLIAAIAAVLLWHGPLGAAHRFSAQVERTSRQTLDYWEMTQVSAHLHHGPLTRRLVLSGPADDFQTSELVRVMSEVPGVSTAQWSDRPAGAPLIAEGLVVSLAGFLVGLLLAYLVELRRRYNAQWNW